MHDGRVQTAQQLPQARVDTQPLARRLVEFVNSDIGPLQSLAESSGPREADNRVAILTAERTVE